MKLTPLISIALLLLCSPFARQTHADDPGKNPCKDSSCHPPRPICLNVFCSFKGEGAGSGADKCQASAVFKKLVTDAGDELEDNSNDGFNPKFEVECDQHQLFDGSAHRYTDAQGTRLQAVIGPYPSVVLPRGALREGHRYEPSILDLGGGESYRGFCFIYTGPQLM